LRDRISDPSLSVLLVLEISIIFFAAPLALKCWPLGEVVLDVLTWTVVVIVVFLSNRRGAIFSILLGLVLLSADFWSGAAWLPFDPRVLGYVGSILGFSAVTWVAHAVFAPGRVTARRVQGAVVVYLNLAMIFASVYRLIGKLNPAAFNNAIASASPSALGTMLYFSLVTLTTTGYGDVTPVDPFARSVANLEAIIGQFYLANTIARLVALEIADRRR
jgi:voltage-gated potassium channel Kch